MGDDTSQKKADSPDVVLIHGTTDDGKGLRVLRAREQRLELGQVRPLEHGKPVQGDVVKLRPRPEMPFVCDVETEVELPQTTSARSSAKQNADGSARRADTGQASRKGPAQVASHAYRQNWDNIWNPSGGKKTELLN